MALIKITELTNQLEISSRSLRYYEQMGLIQSIRSEGEKYRTYDEANVERLKQVMVLRKMQMPIKDIIRIYESHDISVVVASFVNRIQAIDREMEALSELKRVVNEFLQAMLHEGVTKISALPILYEQMEKQLTLWDGQKKDTQPEHRGLPDQWEKPVEPVLVNLPAMRVMSSCLKASPKTSDPEGFWRWAQAKGMTGEPGRRERFEFQADAGEVIILRVADDFANDSDYVDWPFQGGLFAALHCYVDEDLGQRFRGLMTSFDDNPFYEIDYTHGGNLRQEAMIENLISPDDRRELVALYVPVKKRLANPALYDRPVEVQGVTALSIEALNPALWQKDIPIESLTPLFGPHFRINEAGEGEYIAWISPRVLSTNVAVALPFRVDIAFRVEDESAGFGYGSDEGSIRIYHGEDLQCLFGVNMENNADQRLSQEAIAFHQPLFGDYTLLPKRGGITPGVYNTLTWIVGEQHFAVIINGEVRYCATGFPYMGVDLSRQQSRTILIGSNGQGKRFIRSIRLSQLVQSRKNRLKEGDFAVITKRSNNMIPRVHPLITKHYGENYGFNGCAKYVMECLNEPDYDYAFFAGLTGDVFAQVFSYQGFRGDGVTDYRLSQPGGETFLEGLFEACGYGATFVSEKRIRSNKAMWLQTLIACIDKGVPVIGYPCRGSQWGWCVFVGYEAYGRTLLFLTDDMAEPARVSFDDAIQSSSPREEVCSDWCKGWTFVGEKKTRRDLAQIYREAILRLPQLLLTKNPSYCFGAEAFRAWADEIESGKFDGMQPADFDTWTMYTVYVCNLATNGSCCHGFLEKAQALNPDMTWLQAISRHYEAMAQMWNGQGEEANLEALGGGFNVTLGALQDRRRRDRIVSKIRAFADCMDEVQRILKTQAIPDSPGI